MRSIIINILVTLVFAISTEAATKSQSSCQQKLTKQEKALVIDELVDLLYEVQKEKLAGYSKDNSPKEAEFKRQLKLGQQQNPNILEDIKAKLAQKIQNSSKSPPQESEEIKERASKKLLGYEAVRGGEALDGVEWVRSSSHLMGSKMDIGFKPLELSDGQILEFDWPQHQDIKIKGKDLKRKTSTVFHLRDNYVIDLPKTKGPIHVYEVSLKEDPEGFNKSKLVHSFNVNDVDNVRSLNNYPEFHFTNLSEKLFAIYSALTGDMHIRQWTGKGKSKLFKKFNSEQLEKFRTEVDIGDSTCLLSNKHLVSIDSIGQMSLWDISGKSLQAKPLAISEDDPYVEPFPAPAPRDHPIRDGILAVDDEHFFTFYNFAQVALWKIEKDSSGKYEFKLISTMNNRKIESKVAMHPKEGHVAGENGSASIRIAALVEKDLLLTVGADQRIILSRFDLKGEHKIEKYFPMQHPKMDDNDNSLIIAKDYMNRDEVEQVRWQYRQGELWLESGHIDDRILWRPIFFADVDEL